MYCYLDLARSSYHLPYLFFDLTARLVTLRSFLVTLCSLILSLLLYTLQVDLVTAGSQHLGDRAGVGDVGYVRPHCSHRLHRPTWSGVAHLCPLVAWLRISKDARRGTSLFIDILSHKETTMTT